MREINVPGNNLFFLANFLPSPSCTRFNRSWFEYKMETD